MISRKVQFDFIISDPVSNPKPGKSLQIRSRCMRGKNKRDDSRRTQREKRKVANDMKSVVLSGKTRHGSTTLSPRPSTSYFVPLRFAGCGINSEAEMLLSNVFAFNFLASDVTPLERCTNLDCLESSCFSWLFTDTAFMHSILCASYAIRDFMSPHSKGNPGIPTTFHLQATLSSLRVKMQEEYAYQDESVLRAIMNLALLAIAFRDWIAAAAHLKGLVRIVHLRGNTEFLKTRPIIHFKLDRIDLAWSLSSGQKPYFVQPIKSWDCQIAPPYSELPHDLYQPSTSWDYRIVNAFKDFQNLTLMINRNKLKYVIHNPAICQEDLTSLQARLICLAEIVTKPIEELVRLAMLAMLTTTFQLPGRTIPYDWIVKQLRKTYTTLDRETREDKSLLLWVLLTTSFTVTRVYDTWIRDAWKTVAAGHIWDDVQARLLRIMWIEIVHNKPGKRAYHRLCNAHSNS